MRLLCALLLTVTLHAQTPDWQGTYRGTLINYPTKANAPTVDVTLEVGAFPTTDHTCTPWKTTYSQNGEVKQVKDYQLCRGDGPDDLYTDEGDGLHLAARLLGNVLVTPFKYNDTLLILTNRLRGDLMEEEIITVADQPAIKGPLALQAKGLQRLVLKRVVR